MGSLPRLPTGPGSCTPGKWLLPKVSLGVHLPRLPHPGVAAPGKLGPAPAYLGLLGLAAALESRGAGEQAWGWAAKGFFRCCAASNGAWSPSPEAPVQGPRGRSPQRSRIPPRTRRRAQGARRVLAMDPPSWHAPQVAMIEGRRANEEEIPTTVWLDPPSAREVKVLLIVLQAMRSGAFVVGSLPGAQYGETLRVRGLDQPPRQGCVSPRFPRRRTPWPSSALNGPDNPAAPTQSARGAGPKLSWLSP